jgi:hypothetical protein
MKIHTSGKTILANGIVHARIALPEGMDVILHVTRVLPDVLIFDGPLSTASTAVTPITTSSGNPKMPDDDVPPAPPLPSPLPPHAFARVRPNTWLTAVSEPTAPRPDWNERGHTTLYISAWFADVPLEVLSGREREFRSFVGKVIFGPSEGAVAGVQGVAAAGARVEGFPIGEDKDEGDNDDESAGHGDEDGGLVLTGLPFQGTVRIGRKGLR